MWQLFYIRALEIGEEYRREAGQLRLARLERGPSTPRRSRTAVLRRTGAVVAVWIARRIDPGATRQAVRRNPRKLGSA
jgi:hypothetical protein